MDIKRIFWIVLVCCCVMTAVGQRYRVGDVYTAPDGSRGIVYYLHPDGSGGWVVALHDIVSNPGYISVPWGPDSDVPGLQNQAYPYSASLNLLYDTAGYANTLAIRNFIGASNEYAAGLVDFDNGWVLPSPAQLIKLMSQRPFINTSLISAGGDTLLPIQYWTSAAYSVTQAWCVSAAWGGFMLADKTSDNMAALRAVRAFTYEPTYVWSTGDSGTTVIVQPDQTTTYTVSASLNSSCNGVAEQIVEVNPKDTTIITQDTCEFFVWRGQTLWQSGEYIDTFVNVHGCDSMVILNLTIHNPIHQSITATGIESYEWHDSVYTQDGDYLFSHLDENGCTQVDTLHLTIYHGTMTQLDTTVCESDLPFEWGGVVFTTAGTHVDTLHTFVGADSLVFWNLHVVELPVITHSPDTAVLAGDSLTLWAAGSDILTWTDGNGNPVGNGITVSIRPLTSGYYYVTGYSSGEIVGDDTSVLHCPATDSIWVEVLPNPDTMLLTDSACVYYVWYGDTLTQSDVYYHTMTNWLGYDSVEVLTLTVFPTTYGTLDTMVIENALPLVYNDSSYATEGTYTQNLINVAGCDSLLVVNVYVHYNVTTNNYDTICESQLPHTWNDSLFTAAGTKQTTLLASTGVDSTVVMHLTVIPTTYGTVNLGVVENALPLQYNDSVYEGEGTYIQNLTNVAGCDSILTVNVTVYENVENIADSTICESSLPFTWNGVTFTEAGSQPVTLTASTGADSVLMMIVTVVPTTTFDTSVIACDSFTWQDSTYTVSGVYVFYLPNAEGCDSVVTLNLTVRHSTTYVDEQNVCDSLRWIDGILYVESTNEPTFTLTNAAGCDSVVNLNLTVRHSTSGIDVQDVCDSLLWIDGILYVESTDEQTYTLTNAAGCDSVVTLNLTVRHSTSGVDVQNVCDSLRWIDGNLYTESTNEPTFTLTNVAGCDSVVTLNLTVRHSTTYVDVYDVCDSLRWIDGNLYTESTSTPTFTLTNAAGCDSVVTLNLTVRHSTTYVDVQNACDSLRWIDGILYVESTNEPTYTLMNAAGCDSVVILNLTVGYSNTGIDVQDVCDSLRWIDGILYVESTNEPTYTLTNAAGCDSVVTLHLTVRHSSTGIDTHDVCDSLRWIDGTLYTESTNAPTFTLTNAAGCDSVVTLHLTVRHSTNTTINAEIVQNNLPYTLNDSAYTATGTYYQHFTNAVGCDSTVTLNLTVYNNTTAQVYATVCANALPYTWGGHVFTAAGIFTDTLLTSHGADSVVTYTLTVDEIAATIPTVTHVTCFGGSNGAATATVTGGMPNFAYAWTNAEGASVSTSTSISNQPAGTYTFTVTDVIGCVATATVTLNTLNDELQPGTIAEDQVVCEGEQPLPFTGTSASGGDNGAYQWQVSTNGTDWTAAPGTNNAQNYTYPNVPTSEFSLRRAWVSQSCGTVYSNTVAITLWPNSSDTVTGAVCQNEAFEGFGFEVTADQTAAPGEYTFEQHHATGHCDSVVVLILTVNPLFETEVEDVVCEGEGYEDNGFSINPLETVGEEQLTRILTLQSAAGCDSVVTLHLRVTDTAVRIVSLTPDFCEDLSAELMVVTDMPNYVWSTGETAPTITVTHSGRYYVTATSGECSSTAHFTVENCDGDQLLLPNAITPSRGDGLNDYFSIPERNLRSINLFEIWIYNRWGELVYYSNDKNFRWNGEYRGQIQYQTVYNYVIKYTDAAGKPYFVKGSVTVL